MMERGDKMHEYTVELIAQAPDGPYIPFHVFIGEPEPGKDGHGSDCMVWHSLLTKPARIKGETPRHAYSLAFEFVRLMVGHANLILLDRSGTPFVLPAPPHEFET